MKSFFKVFIIGLKHLNKKIIKEDHINSSAFIIILSFLLPYEIIQENDFNRYTAYTVGIIYKNDMGGKAPGKYYRFYVDNKIYYGVTGYGGLSKIKEGDSIYVAYDYTNPNNNSIIGYYEYRLDRSKLPDTVFHRQQIDKMRRPITK